MTLPTPSPEALALSQALALRISESIQAAGGWMAFDRWMDQALYTPGLGYYSGPLRKFGAEGDFVTAPELSPWFAQVLAVQVAQWFEHTPARIVECGAGSGQLAAGLLQALRAGKVPLERYTILEVSASLRARQQATLAQQVPEAMGLVEWVDTLPQTIEGVVLANELLDALPVRVWQHQAGDWLEWGVTVQDDGAFAWAARPADAALQEAVCAALPDGGAGWLGDGAYRSEWAPQVAAWVRTVGSALRQGAMLLIDYGFPAREYYHPQRTTGTLVAHYRHRVHHDVLRWPGLQDLTAHVDFTAVAHAGQACGLSLLGFVSQARFLLNAGLLDLLAQDMPNGVDDLAQARRVAAVQTLLSEAEMGELFKVIAFGRDMPPGAIGFARGDRRAAL